MAATALGYGMASGQSLLVRTYDGSGNDAPVSGVLSINCVQRITISGPPAGNVFDLSFNGHTTGNLTVTSVPPPGFGEWTGPVTPAVSTTIAFTWNQAPSPFRGSVFFEVFDGSTAGPLLGTATLSQVSAAPSGITAPGVFYPATSTPIPFSLVGTYTFSTSTFVVRISSANTGSLVLIDALYVNVGGTIVIYDNVSSSLAIGGDWAGNVTYETGRGDCYLGTDCYVFGTGTPTYQVSGGAGAIEAALLLLPSISTNGVAVTDAGGGNYDVTFQNLMGGVSQPAITTDSGAVTVATTDPGGSGPTYSINGGSPVAIVTPPSWVPLLNVLEYFLYESFPQYTIAKSTFYPNPRFFTTNSFNQVHSSASVSKWCYVVSGSGYYFQYTFARLPANATYQLYMSWPTSLATSTNVAVVVLDINNTTLHTTTVDETVAPADLSHGGYEWKSIFSHTIAPGDPNTTLALQVQTSGTTGNVVADAVLLVRTSGDNSVAFGPGDVLALTLPGGYLDTTAGLVAAQTLTLANLVGGSLFGTFDPASATMPVAYNLEGDQGPTYFTSNLAHRLGSPTWGSSMGDGVVTYDSDGYPLTINGPVFRNAPIVQVTYDYGGEGNGLAGPSPGLWSVIWNNNPSQGAASDVQANSDVNGTCTEQTAYRSLSSTANVRVYNVQPLTDLVGFDLNIDLYANGPISGGSYPVSVGSIEIRPPDPSDPTGMTAWGVATGGVVSAIPFWHPNFFAQCGSVQAFRFLDVLNQNGNPVLNFNQYRQPSHCSRSGPVAVTVWNIESIVDYSTVPVDPFFCIKSNCVVYITLSLVSGTGTIYDGTGSLQFAGGPTLTSTGGSSFSLINNNAATNVHYVDSTHVLVAFATSGAGPFGQSLANPQGAGGQVLLFTGTAIPLMEAFDLCNGGPSTGGDGIVRDCHLNISMPETDSCLDSVFALAAANLIGKLILEFGNEIWNGVFPAFYYSSTQGYRHLIAQGGTPWSPTNTGGVTDSDFTWFAANGAHNCHQRAITAFATAGRPSTDVIRIIGGQGGNTGITTALCAAMNAIPASFDRFAVSTYVPNFLPISAPPGYATFPTDPTLTVGQELDQYEAIVASGYYHNLTIATNRAVLDGAGFSAVQLMQYEASLDASSAGYNDQDALYVGNVMARDPRAYRLELANLQASQAAGSAQHNQFYFSSSNPFVQSNVLYLWMIFFGGSQGLGTGTAGENSDPFGPHPLSEMGGAIHDWAALVAGSGAAFSGPTTSTVGSPSANFAVVLDEAAGVGGQGVTVASSVGGDVLTPASFTIANGQTTGTFTVTASNAGARTITPTAAGISVVPATLTLTASTATTTQQAFPRPGLVKINRPGWPGAFFGRG